MSEASAGELHPSPFTGADARAALEGLEVQQALTSSVSTLIDSVVCDSYQAAKWEVVLIKGTARCKATVEAWHDGTSGADATAAGYTVYGPDDGGTVDVVLSVDVNGAGATQAMRLLGLASSTGWTAESWRVPQKPAQL